MPYWTAAPSSGGQGSSSSLMLLRHEAFDYLAAAVPTGLQLTAAAPREFGDSHACSEGVRTCFAPPPPPFGFMFTHHVAACGASLSACRRGGHRPRPRVVPGPDHWTVACCGESIVVFY